MEPFNMGLLGLGANLLRPGSNLGDGFAGFQNGLVQGEQLKSQQLYRQAQTANLRSMEEERKAKLQSSMQQQAAMRALMGQLQESQQPPPPAMQNLPQRSDDMLGTGAYQALPDRGGAKSYQALPDPITQMAKQSRKQWTPQMVQNALMAGLKPNQIQMLASAGDLGRPEVARTIDSMDEMGRPQTGQFDKFGQPVGAATRKPYELKLTDRGGFHQYTDPYMGSMVGNQFAKSQSPDSVLSSETARRGQNMTDSRAREFNANQREATNATKAATAQSKKWDDLASLRKEFATLPEVKNFKEIIPAQRSATDALKRDTAQADINLVYATAKIFDPTSVVREGEYGTVSNSAPPAERMQGLMNHLTGGGKLTADTRKALLREINSRADAAQDSYKAARRAFTGIATRNGFAPEDVFADLPELAKQKPSLDSFDQSSTKTGADRPSLDSFER